MSERAIAAALQECDWPDEEFRFLDEPGEHDPCYVIMPGGSMLSLCHHAVNGVDQARARFIVNACNEKRAALAAAQRVAREDDPFTHGKIVGKAIGWDAAKRDSSALLEKLVRKGTDGRWRTTQHGDTDVTHLVNAALPLSQRGEK